YFINNRVVAIHTGVQGAISNWNFMFKASYSQNYGTFGTSPEGHSTGPIKGISPQYGLFGKKNQFSAYLESSTELRNRVRIGYSAAFDNGRLLDNSFGLAIKVSKAF